MPTTQQLDIMQATIGDVYAHLEQAIFEAFVKQLQNHGVKDVDQSSVLQWQISMLNDLDMVNQDVIGKVVEATNMARPLITSLFRKAGYKIADDQYASLAKSTGKKVKNNITHQVLDGYLKQTFLDLDNNVNQTLITTNYGQSNSMRVFQGIVKDFTAEVITGLRTPENAIRHTVYKWRDKHIHAGLIDRGQHDWSLEGYARMVVNTTSTRAFQAVRDQAAEDYGIETFLMSSHAASRPACAPIQGHLVTKATQGFIASDGEQVYPLDSFGYKEPGGAFGINCRHIMWPFIPGVNTNNQEQFDPAESVKRGKVQAQQRELERRIRRYKGLLAMAQQLNDRAGEQKYKLLVRQNQAGMRWLVQSNDFLARDYSREQVYTGVTAGDAEEERTRRLIDNDKRVQETIDSSIKSNVQTSAQKHAAVESYESFKRDGKVLSNHAVEQYQNRQRHEPKQNKNGSPKIGGGRIIFNYAKALKAMQAPINYTDNGRDIRFHNGMVIVSERDTFNTVVTIYRADKPKKRWKRVDKNS